MNPTEPNSHRNVACASRHGGACRSRRVWVVGLLAIAAIVGATVAFNAQAFGHSACSAWHGHTGADAAGQRLKQGVDRLFARADASPEQTAQAHATVDSVASTTTLSAMLDAHRALRSGFVAQLSAPTIDRVALETLRVQAMARLDADSRTLVRLAGDLAEILSPAQRKRLAGSLDPSAHP